MENSITNHNQTIASTAKEVAKLLGKSESWVYKYKNELGARKLGGSLLFPNMEELHEHIFCKEKGVEIRLHSEWKQTHGSVVQHKDLSKTSGVKKKRGTKESSSNGSDGSNPNRYGLLDIV
jgi:predicted DNA-binding transcriptional regulator AlpA